MDTVQIQHDLQDVNSFLGVYASDLLTRSIVQAGTVIVNTDPHTQRGSHWQAINFQNPRSSKCYFFDSYGCHPHIPSFLDFIRRNCTLCQYNRTQLQGPTTTVGDEYCCLFALYMDRGYTPQQYVGLFAADSANRHIHRLFRSDIVPKEEEGNIVPAYIKGESLTLIVLFCIRLRSKTECVIDFEVLHGEQNEEVVQEVSVEAENVIETFDFKSPYPMSAHGSDKNGLSWCDGQLEYTKLNDTIREAVSGYAHMYAYGTRKTKFLSNLGQPVRNLQDFNCPPPHGPKAQFSCSMQCHKNYLNYRCATRNAHTLFK